VPVSELARREVAALAVEYRPCYQCGQCTAACPSGADLTSGPRRMMRLLLAEQAEELLACEDIWRCTGCGACSAACPMDLDVAAALARLRALERAHGRQRCPERGAAVVATRRLADHDTIDSLAFGAAMTGRGFVPSDVVGAAGAAARLLQGRLRRVPRSAAARPPATAAAPRSAPATTAAARPFYTGCALTQDGAAHALTRAAIAGLDLPLAEVSGAPCCGHPSRGAEAPGYGSDETVVTTCPACDRSLQEGGTLTIPLWEALVDHALRNRRVLTAAGAVFVPYVGCLAESGRALDALAAAAALAHVDCLTSYPALHSGCCGALGGMYRGETQATRRLLDYAAARDAPVVTTCLLCRDNLRSAVRRRRLSVQVAFWPEFFGAAGPDDPTEGDDHD
jgi:Fe-S oxidoreductase